ncbi:MAG: cupredoxin domain-containing protein [Candidatus Dormibacteria bacterium]
MRWAGLGLTVVALLSLSACGEETRVGGNGLLNFTPAVIASASPSPSPSVAVAAHPTATQARPAPTISAIATQRPAVAPTVVQVYALRITASGFNPYVLHVPTGGRVRLFNDDNVAHTWTADGGQWDSGPVAAGKTWDYVASVAGDYYFHDATRPSNTGQLQVG